MKGNYTPEVFVKKCRSLQVCLSLFLFLALCLSHFLPEAYAIDQQLSPHLSNLSPASPVYLIPDQSESPFKIGLAIHADNNEKSIESAFYNNNYIKNPLTEIDSSNQNTDVSTVLRIALDEFKFISGINRLIQDAENTMNTYTRKLMLTGELNLDPKENDPVNYIDKVNIVAQVERKPIAKSYSKNRTQHFYNQFVINRVSWNIGFSLHSPGLSLKMDFGKFLMLEATAGHDSKAGFLVSIEI